MGSKQWSALAPFVKRSYDSIASSSSSSKRVCLESDKVHVKAQLATARKRAAEELLQEGLMSRLSSCRMEDAQRQRLQDTWETLEDVPRLRRRAIAGLNVPSPQIVQDMASVEIPRSVSQEVHPQEWCKRICKHRNLFVQQVRFFCWW